MASESRPYGNAVSSRSNLHADVILSALQKFIRRGNYKDACFFAYDLFRTVSPKIVWQRLLISAVEDVGLGNFEAISFVENSRLQWKKSRECIEHSFQETPQSYLILFKTVIYLSKSKKSRAAYTSNIVFLSKCDLSYNEPLSKEETEPLTGKYIHIDNVMSAWFKENKKLLYASRNMLRGLEKNDPSAFLKWAVLIYEWHAEPEDTPCVTDITDVNSRTLLWTLLCHLEVKCSEYRESWISNREERLFFMLACLYVCMPDERSTYTLTEDDNELAQSYVDTFVKDCFSPNEIPSIPDYVYDKHTRQGKKLHRGITHIINEASKVTNEAFRDPFAGEAASIYLEAESINKRRTKARYLRETIRERVSHKKREVDVREESTRVKKKSKKEEPPPLPSENVPKETEVLKDASLSRKGNGIWHSYFARFDEEKWTFVQGPFATEAWQVEKQLLLDKLKHHLDPSWVLPMDIEKKSLITDVDNTVQTFLLSKDLSFPNMNRLEWEMLDDRKSVFWTKENASTFFFCVLAFRYCFEIKDTDKSSFLLNPDTGEIYSVDELNFLSGSRLGLAKRALPAPISIAMMTLLRKCFSKVRARLLFWKTQLSGNEELRAMLSAEQIDTLRTHLLELEMIDNWGKLMGKPYR